MLTTDGRVQAARRRREGSRRRILEAAEILFARDGYGPTSVEAIAALAGVGPATVYNCFGAKGGVAAHLFREEAEILAVQAHGDLEKGPAAAEAIHRHWERVWGMLEARRPLVGALLTAVHETSLADKPPSPERDPRRVLPLPRPFAEIIRYGQTKGEFRLGLDSGLAAVAIINVLSIAFINRRSPTDQEQFLDFFLRGLENGRAGENSAQ